MLCVLPIVLGAPIDLLLAAPLLLMALPLLAGRYLGENALDRLVRFAASRRRPRVPVAARSTAHGPRALLARGGALLARSLAVRPPPAAAVIH